MPIVDLLEIGKQGLDANRQGLQTSSNNIANANTPGYSRQRAVLSTNDQPLQGQTRLPGVNVKQTIRVHDKFVQNQIVDEFHLLGSAKMRTEGLRRVEGAVHNEAFRVNDLLNGFFNDLRQLSANPETNALRSNVIFSAQEAANGFRSLSNNLVAVRDDMDSQIAVAVERVNTLAQEVADLNGKIAFYEGKGEPPLELLDRRDVAVREIAQKLGFQDFVDTHDRVNMTAGGLGVLVNGTTFSELVVMRTPENGAKSAGSYDVFVKDGQGLRSATNYLKEGEIGGMIHVRDRVINPTLKHLDAVAYQFADNVNLIHRQGVGGDGFTGRDLFENSTTVQGAAQRIKVTEEIRNNSRAIAVGAAPDLTGDNRVALALADLQNMTLVSDDPTAETAGPDRQTLNESLTSLVGKVGVQVEHEDRLFRHQEAVVSQLENYRQSVSGVSLDEEAVSMMQFQSAFNASAKAMKVGDELLQTILNIKQ
jgi:flagellar hook-associated protein 1 FlgK